MANFGEGAYLKDADLNGANLKGADLSDADLSGAYLIGAAYLWKDADLSHANLIGAKGITKDQLEQQSQTTLDGTIMPDGTITAGRYVSHYFGPALSFRVSDGWWFPEGETSTKITIWAGPEGSEQLIFTNPGNVFDPNNLSELKAVPWPENAQKWVSWFQNHPNLDTSNPVSVFVGKVSGKQIDVTYESRPENYPRDICGEEPCVPLYEETAGESAIISYEGWKDRLIILDVEGETVIIDVAAPTDKFDEFTPKVQKVLDTLEWESG